jgi:hypothetical protein
MNKEEFETIVTNAFRNHMVGSPAISGARLDSFLQTSRECTNSWPLFTDLVNLYFSRAADVPTLLNKVSREIDFEVRGEYPEGTEMSTIVSETDHPGTYRAVTTIIDRTGNHGFEYTLTPVTFLEPTLQPITGDASFQPRLTAGRRF